MTILIVCMECHILSKKRGVEWLRRPVKVVVGLAKSGVGLERKKNEGTVSLRVVVVLVERGVNLG
jgi:hypothetical protein